MTITMMRSEGCGCGGRREDESLGVYKPVTTKLSVSIIALVAGKAIK